MDITIRLTGDENSTQLNAIAALIATLGGRVMGATVQVPDTRPPQPEVPAALASTVSSETLLEHEARRAAGEPTASGTSGTEFPQFDSLGLPYDERIHSKPQTLNGDGTFRKRRGLDDATFERVSTELKGGVPNPPATVAAPADTASGAAVADNASEAPPPPPPATEAPDAPGGTPTFAGFPAFVAEINKFGMVYKDLTPIAEMFGAANFPGMKDHPESWGAFYEMCAAQKA